MTRTSTWLLAIAVVAFASTAVLGAAPPAASPQGTPELRPFTRPPPDHVCHIDTDAVRQAFSQALNARRIDLPSAYLYVEQNNPEMARFMIRLAPDGALLPTAEEAGRLHQETGKLQPGANQLLVGIVYCSGNAYRMLWHTTTVETGVITQGGKGDGFGDAHGVEQAATKALGSAALKSWSAR